MRTFAPPPSPGSSSTFALRPHLPANHLSPSDLVGLRAQACGFRSSLRNPAAKDPGLCPSEAVGKAGQELLAYHKLTRDSILAQTLDLFCLKKILPHWLHYSRALSGAEAINALRPFYFAVHPDFFGQHPREREINENSLKRLRFRAVRFTLHTSDLLSTVLYILNSCSLSVEHIQSLNTNMHSQPLKEATGMPDRPIKWHRSYYSFTGFKDPDEDLEHVSRVETTLMWQRGWGVAHRCSQLHRCTIVFTDRSGMSALGHVMLGTMDVHHHWMRLFESLPSYFDLQRRMSALEDQISNLLGGIQVVYIEELQPALTLDEYYSLLDVFYNQLLKSRIPSPPQSLSGLQMILSSDRHEPSLHELGHFNVPALSDPRSLQSFMRTKAQQARESMTRREELKVIENELIQASTKKFSLEKLYKEPSISSRQMVDCCKRLLQQSLPYLHGMHLCVSHFYSVMQDGDLCIPWNWKKGEAMK
ncbi:hypothetical protein A6R68_21371 [Neotoma lepida]|uniref:DUF4461 domain-containing protein n=1 Tax=Neotoma lepida TaxID=56216 RepID=A0A1A6HQ92_NEOLE|nr:hypothetical protein A6R68_21371 [Neotoma lepida]